MLREWGYHRKKKMNIPTSDEIRELINHLNREQEKRWRLLKGE